MTVTRFFQKKETFYGDKPYQDKPDGLLDIIPKAYTYTRDNFNVDAEQRLMNEQYENQLNIYEKLNEKAYEKEDSPVYNEKEVSGISTLQPRDAVPLQQDLKYKYYDAKVIELKTQNPEKYKDLKTREEMKQEALKQANLSKKEYAESVSRVDGFTRTVGTLAGGFAASLTDPLNLATLPIGASASTSILKTAVIEAAVNAGVEVVSTPQVAKWQVELGERYGLGDAASDIGLAALFGGAMGAGTKAIGKGIGSARDYFSKLSTSETAPAIVKKAARYLERTEHINSQTPYKDVSAEKHVEDLNETVRAYEEGRTPILKERGAIRDDIPQSFRDEIKSPEIIEPNKASKYFEEPEIRTKERQRAFYEEAQGDEATQAIEQDFKRMIEENPDETFTVEFEADDTGRVTEQKLTGKQILDEIENDSNYIKAISNCALGK